MQRVSSWIIRHPFHLYGSEAILGIEDKETKYDKRCSPCFYSSWNPTGWEAVSQESWMRPKYVLVINHTVTWVLWQKRHRRWFEDSKCEKPITLTVFFRAYNEKLMPPSASGRVEGAVFSNIIWLRIAYFGTLTNVLQNECPSETAWNDSVTALRLSCILLFSIGDDWDLIYFGFIQL